MPQFNNLPLANMNNYSQKNDIRKVKVMNKLTRNIYYILKTSFYKNPQKYLIIKDKSQYEKRMEQLGALPAGGEAPEYIVNFAPITDQQLQELKITKKQYKHPFKQDQNGDFVITPSIFGEKYQNVFDFVTNGTPEQKEVLYVFVTFPDKVHVGWDKDGTFQFAVLDKPQKKLVGLTFAEAIATPDRYKLLSPVEYRTVLDILASKKRRQIRKEVLNLKKAGSYDLLRLALSMLFANNHKRQQYQKFVVVDNSRKYLPFIFNKKYQYHTQIIKRGNYWYTKLNFNIPIYKQPLIQFDEQQRDGQVKYMLPDGSSTIYKRQYLKSIILNKQKVDDSTVKQIFLEYFKFVPISNIDQQQTDQEDLKNTHNTRDEQQSQKQPVAQKRLQKQQKQKEQDK